MKRFLSLAILMALIISANSQNIPAYDKSKLNVVNKSELISNEPVVQAPVMEQSGPRAMAPNENIIGVTFYDLQTNKSVQNRVFRYNDGSIGAVWTMGMEATAFPGRGAGYNYYDGTTWGPSPAARIESVRCGWPSYSPLGATGELVISHDFGAAALILNQRETRGTGDWVESIYTYSNGPPSLSWPRHITAGPDNNSIHILVNSVNEYEGMTSAQVYSRSTDAGASFDIENSIIEGMGDDYYLDLAADEIVWADPVGNNIAFLCMGAWHDLFMMKSIDDGDSWEKTIIWEHPYPFFDWDVTIADTFFCVDQSASITLGPDGKAHVTFGISRVAHFEVGTSYNYWPYVDGIGYWNEDMDVFSNDLDALAPPQYGYANSEMIEDVNYIGWTQDVDGDGEVTFTDELMSYRSLGISTMPSITVDEWGNVVVLFASTTETYFNETHNYKHIWARAYDASTSSWLDFYDLTGDIVHIFDECIYPQLASSSDENIYYLYNTDITPGLALDDDHAYQNNNQVFAELSKLELGLPPVGIEEGMTASSALSVSQNYPNPANGQTVVRTELLEATTLSMEVSNMVGQIVMKMDKGNTNAGSHQFSIDVSQLESGTYFYTVIAGENRITKRMIVR